LIAEEVKEPQKCEEVTQRDEQVEGNGIKHHEYLLFWLLVPYEAVHHKGCHDYPRSRIQQVECDQDVHYDDDYLAECGKIPPQLLELGTLHGHEVVKIL
jgi:hypothetical protein